MKNIIKTIPFLVPALVLAGWTNALYAQGLPEAGVACTITENGSRASGTLELIKDGKVVTSGPCGPAINASPGSYTAVLSLDGALDQPQKSRKLTVSAGKVAQFSANFETGLLQIQAESDKRRVAAMATLSRDGERVGNLGMGVTAHLSAGNYDVVVQYRDKEKRFAGVKVSPGQRQVLNVSF